jgi:hypothetical protein
MQGQCLDVANRMARRFLGEHGPEYLVPTYDRPRYLIKIVPTKIRLSQRRRSRSQGQRKHSVSEGSGQMVDEGAHNRR